MKKFALNEAGLLVVPLSSPPAWLTNTWEIFTTESSGRAEFTLGTRDVGPGRRVVEDTRGGRVDAAAVSSIRRLPGLFSPAARSALRSTTSASELTSCTAGVGVSGQPDI